MSIRIAAMPRISAPESSPEERRIERIEGRLYELERENARLRRRCDDLAGAVRLFLNVHELIGVALKGRVDATKALGWVDEARALTCPETAEEDGE